jgi:hypothetical protein
VECVLELGSRKTVILLILAMLALIFRVHAQTHVAAAKPQSVEDKLAQSYSAMYDLKFQEAFKAADEAKAIAQTDPLPYLASAWISFFRELNRLHILRSDLFATDDNYNGREVYVWDEANKKIFDSSLDQAEKLAQDRLNHDSTDPRALLALAFVNGLHGDELGVFTKKDLKAISYIKSATTYAEKLLSHSPDSYDAYVATGMGKVIVGRKSAPVRWVLRLGGLKGDEAEGLKELTLAADHAHYLAPFARLLVVFEDVRFKNIDDARKRLEDLRQQFPDNPLFREELEKLGRASAQLTR